MDITPTQGLSLEVIDLIDNHRYTAQSGPVSSSFTRIADDVTTYGTPSGSPVCSMQFGGSVVLNTEAVYQQVPTITSLTTAAYQSVFSTVTISDSGDKPFNDYYGAAFPVQPSYNFGSSASQSIYVAGDAYQSNQFLGVYDEEMALLEARSYGMLGGNSNPAPSLMQSTSSFATPFGYNQWTNLPQIPFTQTIDFTWKNPSGAGITAYSGSALGLGSGVFTSQRPQIYNANKATVVNTGAFPFANGFSLPPTASCTFTNSISQCGYLAGARVSKNDGSAAFTTSNWSYSSSLLCSLGDQCTYNIDCKSGLMCMEGVCSQPPLVATPFVSVFATTNQFHRGAYYYNSSFGINASIAALVAVVLALVF